MKNTSPKSSPMHMSKHERAAASPVPWIKPIFSQIHHVEHSRSSTCPRHRHAGDFEIVAVEKGIYHTRLNDTPLILNPSQLLVVKPGDWHEDFFNKGLEFYCIYFRLESEFLSPQATLLFCNGVLPHMQKGTIPNPSLIPLFRQIQHEAEKPDDYSANLQDALSTEFFWFLVRALGKNVIHPEIIGLSEEQRFRSEMYRLFQKNVHTHLSVNDMAHHMNESESSFAHRCKALTGDSPANAFMSFKIAQAKMLLESTGSPIKEISAQFGFTSPYHFSHAFKRITGTSPSKSKRRSSH